jgi:hypothetical protein
MIDGRMMFFPFPVGDDFVINDFAGFSGLLQCRGKADLPVSHPVLCVL